MEVYNEKIIPPSVLALLVKSETRCFPFCSHPGCWQSVEREIRNIPRWMIPTKLQAQKDIKEKSGWPILTINDLLEQNENSFTVNKVSSPPLPSSVSKPLGYVPMLQRWKEIESEVINNRRLLKQAEVLENESYEIDHKRQAPRVLVWVPRYSRKRRRYSPRSLQYASASYSGIRNVTDKLFPTAETTVISDGIKVKKKTLSEKLKQRIEFKKYTLSNLLSNKARTSDKVIEDNAADFLKTGKVAEMSEMIKLSKEIAEVQFLNRVDTDDDLKSSTTLLKSALTNRKYLGSQSLKNKNLFLSRKTELPQIKRAAPTGDINRTIPSIGLGLPSLPDGLKTTQAFTYKKNIQRNFTLAPLIDDEKTKERIAYLERVSRASSTLESLFVEAPTPFSVTPSDKHFCSSNFVPYKEHFAQPQNTSVSLDSYKNKVDLSMYIDASDKSSWPSVPDDPQSPHDKSRFVHIMMPTVDSDSSTKPTHTLITGDDQDHTLAKTDISERVQSQTSQRASQDSSLIVIRSDSSLRDPLSIPPMFEEGADSDDIISISACPPEHLDDSSRHLTPVPTSISPIESYRHWVKQNGANIDDQKKNKNVRWDNDDDEVDTDDECLNSLSFSSKEDLILNVQNKIFKQLFNKKHMTAFHNPDEEDKDVQNRKKIAKSVIENNVSTIVEENAQVREKTLNKSNNNNANNSNSIVLPRKTFLNLRNKILKEINYCIKQGHSFKNEVMEHYEPDTSLYQDSLENWQPNSSCQNVSRLKEKNVENGSDHNKNVPKVTDLEMNGDIISSHDEIITQKCNKTNDIINDQSFEVSNKLSCASDVDIQDSKEIPTDLPINMERITDDIVPEINLDESLDITTVPQVP